MAFAKPPIISWMRLVYWDAYRAWRAMPQLALTMFLISVTQSLILLVLFARGSPLAGMVSGRALVAALKIGWLFLLMPFIIAVHRFVLLDEIAPRYTIEPQSRRLLRFFGSWFALSMVAAIPILWMVGLAAMSRLPETWIMIAIVLGMGLIPLFLCLRMSILFPAIAVDASGANWSNAFRDTKGRGWGIFLLFSSALLIFLVISIVLAAVAWTVAFVGTWLIATALPAQPVVTMLITAAHVSIQNGLYLMGVTVFAAVASRLYQFLGDQVKQPPAVPHAA